MLLKMCSYNWEKLKFRSFNFTLKNRFFQHQYQKQVKMFVFTSWLVSHEFLFPYNISLMGWEIINFKHYISRVNQGSLNKCYLNFVELIKRRSKVKENMSCEHVLNFAQWKTFSENHEPIRVWLWLIYKITENCQIYRLFPSSFKLKRGILPPLVK